MAKKSKNSELLVHYARTMTPENLSRAANYVGGYVLRGLGAFGKIMTSPLISQGPTSATIYKSKELLAKERTIENKSEELLGKAMAWVSPLNYGAALWNGHGLNARKGEEEVASWSPAWQAVGRLGELYVGPKAVKGIKSAPRVIVNTAAKAGVKPAKVAVVAREIKLATKNKPNIEISNPTEYNISDNITLYRANPTNIKNLSYKGERYGDTSGLYVGKWFTDESSKPNWYASNMAKRGEEPAYYLVTVPRYWAKKQKASHKISNPNIEYEPEDYILEDGITGLNGQIYQGRPGTIQYLLLSFQVPKLKEPSTSLAFFEKPSYERVNYSKYSVDATNPQDRAIVMKNWEARYPDSKIKFYSEPEKGTIDFTGDEVLKVGEMPLSDRGRAIANVMLRRMQRFPFREGLDPNVVVGEGGRVSRTGIPGFTLKLKDLLTYLYMPLKNSGNTEGVSFAGTPYLKLNPWRRKPYLFSQIHEGLSHPTDAVVKEMRTPTSNRKLLGNVYKDSEGKTHAEGMYGRTSYPEDIFEGTVLEKVLHKDSKKPIESRAVNWEMITDLYDLLAKKKGISFEEATNLPDTEFLNFVNSTYNTPEKLSTFMKKFDNQYLSDYSLLLDIGTPEQASLYAKRIRSMINSAPKYAVPITVGGYALSLFWNQPQLQYLKQGGKMNILEFLKNGSGIHIKEKNKGKFTSYCGGKVTNECILKGKNSSNPAIRKRATFADNARHFKHKSGGKIDFYNLGGWFKNTFNNVSSFLGSDTVKSILSTGSSLLGLGKGISNSGKIADLANAAKEAVNERREIDKRTQLNQHFLNILNEELLNPIIEVNGSPIHTNGVDISNRAYNKAINTFSFDDSKYNQEIQLIDLLAQQAQGLNTSLTAGAFGSLIDSIAGNLLNKKSTAPKTSLVITGNPDSSKQVITTNSGMSGTVDDWRKAILG